MPHCFTASMSNCLTASLSHCFNAHCIINSLRHCPQHHCPTTPLSHKPTASVSHPNASLSAASMHPLLSCPTASSSDWWMPHYPNIPLLHNTTASLSRFLSAPLSPCLTAPMSHCSPCPMAKLGTSSDEAIKRWREKMKLKCFIASILLLALDASSLHRFIALIFCHINILSLHRFPNLSQLP
jgi:hypothetical protein